MAKHLPVKAAAALLSVCLAWPAVAGGVGAGALGGLGEALQQIGADRQRQEEADAAAKAQRDLIELQHNREMERLRYESDLRIREQQAAQRADISRVDATHPAWRKLVNTPAFSLWNNRQPESVRRLAASPLADDAILLIDLFKRDTPDWPQLIR